MLSACSVDEIAAVNKQISDGAFALTGALRGKLIVCGFKWNAGFKSGAKTGDKIQNAGIFSTR
ncbi:Uncharacterised protein [Escherichia coli]|uniref:Uncharacterized protein n=1 Tax=Escherichia coli TaxID=562 RepID=A0A376KLK7_ECOLX|nr:Uncharacterised protein [Escherichia coli]